MVYEIRVPDCAPVVLVTHVRRCDQVPWMGRGQARPPTHPGSVKSLVVSYGPPLPTCETRSRWSVVVACCNHRPFIQGVHANGQGFFGARLPPTGRLDGVTPNTSSRHLLHWGLSCATIWFQTTPGGRSDFQGRHPNPSTSGVLFP